MTSHTDLIDTLLSKANEIDDAEGRVYDVSKALRDAAGAIEDLCVVRDLALEMLRDYVGGCEDDNCRMGQRCRNARALIAALEGGKI